MPNTINDGNLYLPKVYPTFQNPSFLTLQSGSLGTGNTDIYTVPTGKRALAVSYNARATGSNSNVRMQVRVGASYYGLITAVAVDSANLRVTPFDYVYEPGEIVAVNSTVSGVILCVNLLLFDVSTPFKSSKILGLTTGNQTVYTNPSGKTSFLFGNINVYNGSSAVTASSYIVPNGGSPGATNILNTNTNSANVGMSLSTIGFVKNQEFIAVNSNVTVADGLTWVNVWEIS